MNIDIRDTDMIIDGKIIAFPASYSNLRYILGEARVVPKSEKTQHCSKNPV